MHDLDWYSQEVWRTSPPLMDEKAKMMGPIGLASEAGEALDLLKKHWFQGHALDRTKLVKELGDVMWYMQYTLNAYELTWDEILTANVQKLRARFPGGFSPADSTSRMDTPRGQ